MRIQESRTTQPPRQTHEKGRTSQPLTRLLRRELPHEKDHPTSSIVGTVQDSIEDSVSASVKDSHPFVGFAGEDSEAGAEPEDAGLWRVP